MDLNCLNTIIGNCLLFNFDIANVKSWDGNSGLTITSLSKFCDGYTEDIDLCDWGLTMYDVGRSRYLTGSTEIVGSDNRFKLFNAKYNDNSGNTYNYGIINQAFDSGVGSYFNLSGGFLSNFFKLYGFEYELFPYRYNNGFTLETWLKIDNNTFDSITGDTDGIFLYMGTRSENKFWELFSGNTGHTTCLSGSTLGADHIENVELGIDDNVFALKLTNDKKIEYRYIDEKYRFRSCESNRALNVSGWTHFAITFTPYQLINKFEEVKDCYPSRTGDFVLYVNGRPFWNIPNFNEFWFKPMDTTNDKQIGVPYNISWGGGSFGLKHSYNFNDQYLKDDLNLITVGDNGTFESNITGITSNYSLSADTSLYYSGNTSLAIYNNDTGVTFTNSVLAILNDNPITLYPNKKYEFKCYLNNQTLFNSNSPDNCVTIQLSGTTYPSNTISVINQTGYRNNPTPNEWIELTLVIQTSTGLTESGVIVYPYIYTDTPLTLINNEFKINIDEFTGYRYDYVTDIYQINPNNNDLMIEQYFNGSFIGGIQKMRMYGCSLTPTEILHNFGIDNRTFDLPNNLGGRLIYI